MDIYSLSWVCLQFSCIFFCLVSGYTSSLESFGYNGDSWLFWKRKLSGVKQMWETSFFSKMLLIGKSGTFWIAGVIWKCISRSTNEGYTHTHVHVYKWLNVWADEWGKSTKQVNRCSLVLKVVIKQMMAITSRGRGLAEWLQNCLKQFYLDRRHPQCQHHHGEETVGELRLYTSPSIEGGQLIHPPQAPKCPDLLLAYYHVRRIGFYVNPWNRVPSLPFPSVPSIKWSHFPLTLSITDFEGTPGAEGTEPPTNSEALSPRCFGWVWSSGQDEELTAWHRVGSTAPLSTVPDLEPQAGMECVAEPVAQWAPRSK